jgi:AraC-like DNA-binding protein
MALFFEIKRYANPQEKIKQNSSIRITQQYKDMLTKHVYEKNRISDYAGMLSVSVNHLNKCVKTASGKSAQDLLGEMMLMEAKALLKQTNLSVNEIAWQLRKEDSSDFSKFFKAKTGYTPTQFRKQE